MNRNQTKRQIAGVMVLALLVLTVASASAGCGPNVSDIAITPGGAAGPVTTTAAEAQGLSVRHIPELVPASSTAVLGITTEPAPQYFHNLLEK